MLSIDLCYAFLLVICILSSLLFFKSSFKSNSLGNRLLTVFSFLLIILLLGEFFSLFVNGMNNLLTIAFANVGYALIPVLGLLFALYYTGNDKFLETKYVLLFSIIPLISICSCFISYFYPLIGTFSVASNGVLVCQWNILFYIFVYYSATLSVISLLIFIYATYKGQIQNKSIFLILLLAIFTPLITGLLTKDNFILEFNINPIGYFISLLFVEWAVLGFDLLNTDNVRKEFINYVNAGMMFFDYNNNLREYNNLTNYIFGVDDNSIGKNIDEIFNIYPKFIKFFHSDELVNEFRLPNIHYVDYISDLSTASNLHLKDYRIDLENVWINSFKRKFYNNGKFVGTLVTFYDVSYYKNLNHEKEVLLKEIHHRVKNNLQIILSLLSLDMRFHKDDLEIVIDNIQNRVQSIALIHNKIYNSDNLASVDIGDYLKELLDYVAVFKPDGVKLNYKFEKKEGSLELCIPLGLILIELLNNALKYAFPYDKGNVYVELFVKDDTVHLLIYDDGVGIPDGVDIFNSTSLGLIVVNDLTSQIDATFDKYDCDGAGFEITFKS